MNFHEKQVIEDEITQQIGGKCEISDVPVEFKGLAELTNVVKIGPHRYRVMRPLEHLNINLTMREQQILALLISGKSNKIIALNLGIKPSTVSTYVRQLIGKLPLVSRQQLSKLSVL